MSETQAPDAITEVPTELLAEVPQILADLYRAEGGYKVRVIYLPELKEPEEFHVTILTSGNVVLDTIKLPVLEENQYGLDVFRHPARYSEKLRRYLNGQPIDDADAA